MARTVTRVFKVLLSAVLCLAVGVAGMFLNDNVINAPVVYVDIRGVLDERETAILRQELSTGGLADLSIRDLKPVLEEIGWVHHVNVKKVWPDVLKVWVIKQKAIAKWSSDAYLNADGQVFESKLPVESNLPSLSGPPGAEKLVMSQFQQLSKALQKTGLSVRKLDLDDRGEWVLQLKSEVVVKLGKEDIFERMQRLIKVHEAVGLADKVRAIAEIDTRYPNGVAVSWKDETCTDGCNQFAGNDNIERKQTL